MNIKKSAQNIIKTFNIILAMGFASSLHAEQPIDSAVDFNAPYSEDAALFEQYSYQTTTLHGNKINHERSFKEQQKNNEDRVGSFLYKAIDDPDKVRNQIAGSAILYGLDTIGLGDNIREGIHFIKKNTRYSFGDCGKVQLRTSEITATSCLSDGGSVEFNADYNFDSVQLEFKWTI